MERYEEILEENNLIYKYYETELGDDNDIGSSNEDIRRVNHDFLQSDKGPSFGIFTLLTFYSESFSSTSSVLTPIQNDNFYENYTASGKF